MHLSTACMTGIPSKNATSKETAVCFLPSGMLVLTIGFNERFLAILRGHSKSNCSIDFLYSIFQYPAVFSQSCITVAVPWPSARCNFFNIVASKAFFSAGILEWVKISDNVD